MHCLAQRTEGPVMPTRNVVLTDHQEKLIETLVGSGRHQNASEVLREGLRLVEQREAEDASKLKALGRGARVGGHAFNRGEVRGVETIGGLRSYLDDPPKKARSSRAE